MTDSTTQPRITPNPDGGVILHLPDVTHIDTQVWSADVGLTDAGLAALRALMAGQAPSIDQTAADVRDQVLHAIDFAYTTGVLGYSTPEELLAAYDASRVPASVDRAAPAAWVDGHPQLEAIAAAVWEHCGRSDSGTCVEDDPRNIAVAVLSAVLPTAVDQAAPWLDAAAECNKAGGIYSERGANDAADVAFALMETFLRKAGQAEYVATPCSGPVPCEDGGEPCDVHERLMGHAEGDHELCAPNCGEPWLRRLADETQPTEAGRGCAHCGQPISRVTGTLAAWWVHAPGGNTVCNPQQAASSPRATPKQAAGARQDGEA
ncbi:hypothetical protein [Streptomyces griseoloalbus]|uniref:Uncharacterized protein n=1 Tax=Streptomyces griseoloalbus TaxID=67303 RepID=A0A7W8BX29_9ACTN|nr:hypothetical protein [Streptomyces albaduncus]MBB5129778.1 hypothetical protein [Streptomyces albaduncus]GGW81999.1 hypothetical protein GCM10010340_69980 [Streptomyces albaduncus]